MKKSVFAIFTGLCLVASGAMAQNLYTDSGFDEASPFSQDVTTNTDNTQPDFAWSSGATVPGWRFVAAGGGAGTFAVVAEPTAPSAPNVAQFNRTAASQFQIDRWDTSVPVVSGKIYKHSFWVRKITAEAGSLLVRPFAMSAGAAAPYFENDKMDYRVTGLTQGVWEKHETFMTYPAGAGTSCPYIVPESIAPTFQIDDVTLEDATLMDLCPDGRFENAARLVGWDTTLGATAARGMVGTITTDAANVFEGNQALHIEKTNPGAAGDALFRSSRIGWIEGHTAYLAFSVKNDPSLGADSCVAFALHSNTDGSAEATPIEYLASGAADGSYKRYELEVPVTQASAAMLYLDMRLRDNTNNDGTAEAAWVDFVSIGDLTAGGVPVEMASFDVE